MFLTKKKSGSHYYLYLAKTIPKKGNIWHRIKRKRAESPDLMVAPEHVRYLQELSAAG